jgi:hypothetical protein
MENTFKLSSFTYLTHAVWRQDDNGNRFFVAQLNSQNEAENVVKFFSDKGHKQMYWVETVAYEGVRDGQPV